MIVYSLVKVLRKIIYIMSTFTSIFHNMEMCYENVINLSFVIDDATSDVPEKLCHADDCKQIFSIELIIFH